MNYDDLRFNIVLIKGDLYGYHDKYLPTPTLLGTL